MSLRNFYLLLLIILSACSNTTPLQKESVAPIPQATQTEEDASESRFSANLNELLAQIAKTQEIPLSILNAGFVDAKTIPSIRKLVLPPSTSFKKNWVVYRSRFIEPIRLKAGKTFWEQNRAYLSQVEQDSGVPAAVIVAIIGIETIYGRQTGSFRVKDVLATLAFNYPPTENKASREQLFRDQLSELILLCWTDAGGTLPAGNNTQNTSTSRFNACLNQNSSYAGAIGLPQFMPSSIRNFAVDGDGDGKIDLRQSPKDAIASVANFLRLHNWQPGMPIYFPIPNQALLAASRLADGEPTAKYSVGELVRQGILTPDRGDLERGGVAPQSKALIVDLPYPSKDGEDRVHYVVGLENFISIVNYNRSFFYAQSVAEFAEALGYGNQSAVTAPVQSTNSRIESGPKIHKTKK